MSNFKVGDRFRGIGDLTEFTWQIMEWDGFRGKSQKIKGASNIPHIVVIDKSYYDPNHWTYMGNFTKANMVNNLYEKLCG